MKEFLMLYAKEFFEECPDDFGVQLIETDRAVFGGTNRITWSMRHGFRCDESYCTERFITHFNKLM